MVIVCSVVGALVLAENCYVVVSSCVCMPAFICIRNKAIVDITLQLRSAACCHCVRRQSQTAWRPLANTLEILTTFSTVPTSFVASTTRRVWKLCLGTGSTDFVTGPFLLSILVFLLLVSSLLFLFFGALRQTKLAVRQLLVHVKIVCRIVSYHMTSSTKLEIQSVLLWEENQAMALNNT